MNKIDTILEDSSNINIVAKEIVDIFVLDANSENVEYSFDVQAGKMKENDRQPNTIFCFDTEKGTKLDEIKSYLFDEELAKIKENSEEEKELMEKIRSFMKKVCEIINIEYKNDIEQVIKKVVLGNKKDNISIPEILINSIDIADFSSIPEPYKYLLKITKKNNSSINTDEIVNFVQQREETTGMDVETIVSIEKKAGNDLFKNIDIIRKGKKFLNEITLYFYVDYSIN